MLARILALSASLATAAAADNGPKEYAFHLTEGNRQSMAIGFDAEQSFVVTSLNDGQAIDNGVSVGDRLVSANGESSEKKSNYWLISHIEKRPVDLVFKYGSKADQDCPQEQLAQAYEHVEKGEALSLRKLLEDFKCDMNQELEGKQPLAHLAATQGKVSLIKIVSFYGGKMDRVFQGSRPIHLAASLGHAFAAHVLAVEGADIDAKNAEGLTAFHLACLHAQTEVLKVLRNTKCDWQLKTSGGKTSYDLAKESGDQRTLELVEKMIADKAEADKKAFDSVLKGAEL